MKHDDCHDFSHRLNCWIDLDEVDRISIWDDEHLRDCAACRDRVRTWEELSPLLAVRCERVPATRIRVQPMVTTWIAGAASLLALASIAVRQSHDPAVPSVNVSSLSPVQMPVAVQIEALEPVRPVASPVVALVHSPVWVSHLQMSTLIDPQWADQTMPAMAGLRSGIEPISRTFRTVARLISGESA